MKLLLATIAVLFLTSCDGEKKPAPDPDGKGLEVLNGNWATNCLPNSTAFFGPLGEKRRVEVRDNRVTTYYFLYDNENCTSTSLSITILKKSTVNIDDLSVGMYNIDDSIKTYEIIPASMTVATMLRNQEYCGLEKWQARQKMDVTNRKCLDEIPFRARILYSILKYDDSVTPHTFRLGRFSINENGLTPNSRSKNLANEAHYRDF